MSRRSAREIALKVMFVLEFNPESELDATLDTAKEDVAEVSEKDLEFSKAIIDGAKKSESEIDVKLEEISKEWELKRMSSIDKNILRLAVYEIFYAQEKTPASVAINEAVELAKEYGTDESAGFINGLLGTLVRKNGQ